LLPSSVKLCKDSDNACFYLARPGGTRMLPSSTIKRSGA
jgi:hypothetical protein